MTNEKMEQETQGKTTDSIINQPQNREELLRLITGYGQHASFSLNPPYQTSSKTLTSQNL